MSQYHYYMATGGTPLTGWTEFYSSDDIEAVKKLYESERFAREELSGFKMQKSLNSTLYDNLETAWGDAAKFSDEIGIEVYRGLRSGGDLYFKGFMSASDLQYNKERGWFSFQPRIDDDYREILADADTEYDVKGTLTGLEAIYTETYELPDWTSDGARKFSAYDTFGVAGCATGCIATAIDNNGGGAAVEECYILINTAQVGDIYIFTISNYTKNAGVNPWIQIFDVAGASTALTPSDKEITGNGTYCFELDTAAANGYISIFSSRVAAAVADFSMDVACRRALERDNQINAGILWMTFLERFITGANYMNLGAFSGKIKSTFFNNDSLPTAGPATGFIRYNGNYFVATETDLWCDASTNEFKISFNDIMSDIRETMQCYWYIDESDNFRVEHISWFERIFLESTGVVLTSSTYDKYRPFADAEEFAFNKGELANREQFTWPQFAEGQLRTSDFQGVDIIYNQLETTPNVIKHELGRVTTDIQYVNENQADASGDGYIFIDCAPVCSTSYYEIQSALGAYGAVTSYNAHFSWANLHENYWTWARMSIDGTMNGVATTFQTALRFMETQVRFGYQSDLDINERVITEEGNGFQLETNRNLDTDFLTIKLGFNPYA